MVQKLTETFYYLNNKYLNKLIGLKGFTNYSGAKIRTSKLNSAIQICYMRSTVPCRQSHFSGTNCYSNFTSHVSDRYM